MIHGFADDNVVVAHTLQMSAALNLAAIPHELVLIPKASHMGGSAEVVVSRYLIELDFLRRSLGLERASAPERPLSDPVEERERSLHQQAAPPARRSPRGWNRRTGAPRPGR